MLIKLKIKTKKDDKRKRKRKRKKNKITSRKILKQKEMQKMTWP